MFRQGCTTPIDLSKMPGELNSLDVPGRSDVELNDAFRAWLVQRRELTAVLQRGPFAMPVASTVRSLVSEKVIATAGCDYFEFAGEQVFQPG